MMSHIFRTPVSQRTRNGKKNISHLSVDVKGMDNVSQHSTVHEEKSPQNLFLSKEQARSMSTDEKLELVLNRCVDLISTNESLSNSIKEYQIVISRLVDDNKKLLQENELIKKDLNSLNDQFKHVLTEITDIRNSMDQDNGNVLIECEKLKQNLKKDEIEIWGVPQTDDEDLNEKVVEIANKFDVNISVSDVNFARRRVTKISKRQNLPNPIRVKFYNRRKRDDLIIAGRNMRIKVDDSLESKDGRNYIYVNESLTSHNEFIYGRIRELKRKKRISKGWCRDGKLFIQKGNSPPMLITRIEQLDV